MLFRSGCLNTDLNRIVQVEPEECVNRDKQQGCEVPSKESSDGSHCGREERFSRPSPIRKAVREASRTGSEIWKVKSRESKDLILPCFEG